MPSRHYRDRQIVRQTIGAEPLPIVDFWLFRQFQHLFSNPDIEFGFSRDTRHSAGLAPAFLSTVFVWGLRNCLWKIVQ
jgi:hypothetical protein